MYAIMIDYNCNLTTETGKFLTYTVPCFLGVENNEHKTIVWNDMISSKTKLFESAREAGEYVDNYFKEDFEIYGENLRIVKLYKDNF